MIVRQLLHAPEQTLQTIKSHHSGDLVTWFRGTVAVAVQRILGVHPKQAFIVQDDGSTAAALARNRASQMSDDELQARLFMFLLGLVASIVGANTFVLTVPCLLGELTTTALLIAAGSLYVCSV